MEVRDFEVGRSLAWTADQPISGFYPDADEIIHTQPLDRMDQGRVQHYVMQIAAGAKPVAFLLGMPDDAAKFALDGHHKLAAYEATNIAPRCVVFERWDAAPVLDNETVPFLRACRFQDTDNYLRGRSSR